MGEILVLRLKNDGNKQEMTKQIPNPRKMFSSVEDRHKKCGFLIGSSHGSI